MKLNQWLLGTFVFSMASQAFSIDIYQNQITQNEILVVGSDVKVDEEGIDVDIKVLPLNDDRCRADLENFESPFVYAHPLLVSSSKTCIVTESGVEFVSNTPETPKDNYSISYVYQDEQYYYFAVNGRSSRRGLLGT